MYPILFHVGKFPVYSWGTSLAVAFVVSALYAVWQGKKKGIDPDDIIDLALYACIASILGGRILFVLLNISSYIHNPVSILWMRDGGLSFFGGLAGGILAGLILVKRRGISVGKMADVAAPAIAIGYAIGRLGCLLNGCCYGKVAVDLPWALACGTDGAPRHPTQIYAIIYTIIILFILRAWEGRKRSEGEVMWAYVGLYSVARFIVEFWRTGARDYFAPFTATQAACIVLAILGFGVVCVKRKYATKALGNSDATRPSVRG
ncbi:MAG: prolipoprotein diacylglyceryl transferase [Firmicutes bacterium]|jgi:phosphatidylglycerol:prolipoprotein diacylglycerol transferase|nr:prolipoprotein diacylglyceryl transferase [Bacillota bacterium]MDD4337079.1 prolipoprotein diacylglyceryl transferase [Bacillota bacterium]MDD4792438.1 prolipoprotein diacylglyceryl transferase [Bacillota bacterium]